MPSRIIHLAVASLLEAEFPIPDKNRFHAGTVMPDAAVSRAGHFEKRTEGGRYKTYDLTGFRKRYGDLLIRDSLVLGYYLHLAGDIVQRQLLYNEIGYRPTDDTIPRLHRDYECLNPYVIGKYGLGNDTVLPEGWESVPLARDIPFRLPDFLEEMRGDFLPGDPEGPVIFTREYTDAFVSRAAALFREEIPALLRGESVIDEDAMRWRRMP